MGLERILVGYSSELMAEKKVLGKQKVRENLTTATAPTFLMIMEVPDVCILGF